MKVSVFEDISLCCRLGMLMPSLLHIPNNPRDVLPGSSDVSWEVESGVAIAGDTTLVAMPSYFIVLAYGVATTKDILIAEFANLLPFLFPLLFNQRPISISVSPPTHAYKTSYINTE